MHATAMTPLLFSVPPRPPRPFRPRKQETDPALKVFIGRLSHSTTAADLRNHFEAYGPVDDAYVPKDRETQESRGFGFVCFRSLETVRHVLDSAPHRIGGKQVSSPCFGATLPSRRLRPTLRQFHSLCEGCARVGDRRCARGAVPGCASGQCGGSR